MNSFGIAFMPDGSASSHLYKPKLTTALGEGYGANRFRKDVLAGLTVAIVALPLSMASKGLRKD